jgi:hypothetical protein
VSVVQTQFQVENAVNHYLSHHNSQAEDSRDHRNEKVEISFKKEKSQNKVDASRQQIKHCHNVEQSQLVSSEFPKAIDI